MEAEEINATCPACGRDARTAARSDSLAWCSCLMCGSVDLERREKILDTLRAHHIDRPDDLENIVYRLEIWRGRNEATLGLLGEVRKERDTERAARQAAETERDRLREALQPFADHADAYDRAGTASLTDADVDGVAGHWLRIGDFRRARAALKEGGADDAD